MKEFTRFYWLGYNGARHFVFYLLGLIWCVTTESIYWPPWKVREYQWIRILLGELQEWPRKSGSQSKEVSSGKKSNSIIVEIEKDNQGKSRKKGNLWMCYRINMYSFLISFVFWQLLFSSAENRTWPDLGFSMLITFWTRP